MGARCSECDWDSDHLVDGVCYECAGLDPPELSGRTVALIGICRQPAWGWADIATVIGISAYRPNAVAECGCALAAALVEAARCTDA